MKQKTEVEKRRRKKNLGVNRKKEKKVSILFILLHPHPLLKWIYRGFLKLFCHYVLCGNRSFPWSIPICFTALKLFSARFKYWQIIEIISSLRLSLINKAPCVHCYKIILMCSKCLHTSSCWLWFDWNRRSREQCSHRYTKS